MADLLQDSDDLRQRVIDKLLDNIPDIQVNILGRIDRLLEEFSRDGENFTPEKTNRRKLLRLQSEIEEVLRNAGYYNRVETYISDLSRITANTIELHEDLNKIRVGQDRLNSVQSVYSQGVVDSMVTSGLNYNFIQPVTNMINQAITYGSGISELRQSLSDYVVGNEQHVGKLRSYLTVTARDTVTQMQGAQHQAVALAYKMPFIRYVGGELKDSRGQCVRWLGMRVIAVAELPDEIKLANKNQKNRVEKPKGHKWSGMIDGTTPENFLINRGGWGCLQQAIPVRNRN